MTAANARIRATAEDALRFARASTGSALKVEHVTLVASFLGGDLVWRAGLCGTWVDDVSPTVAMLRLREAWEVAWVAAVRRTVEALPELGVVDVLGDLLAEEAPACDRDLLVELTADTVEHDCLSMLATWSPA